MPVPRQQLIWSERVNAKVTHCERRISLPWPTSLALPSVVVVHLFEHAALAVIERLGFRIGWPWRRKFVRIVFRYRLVQGVLDFRQQLFERIEKKLKLEGLIVATPQGRIRNPLVSILKDAHTEMHRCGSELGLSPAARARLPGGNEPDTDDIMDALLGMDGNLDATWWEKPQ